MEDFRKPLIMEVSGSVKGDHGFARFACDFCRQKKLKCSRELPKCSTCKPWPGSCEYSRDMLFSSQTVPNHPASEAGSNNNFEVLLQKLERTVQHLRNSVDQALQIMSQLPSPSKTDESQRPDVSHRTVETEKSHPSSRLYIGPSHSFSFLQDTSANLEAISQPPSDATRQSAYSELQYLTTRLTTAQVDQKTGEDATTFYVPSRSTGYRLISRFLEHAELGEPFFCLPPDDILTQVVFEPQKVREKAWIVYFNYLLLSIVSDEHDDIHERDKFRHNVQLALNHSSIFLEPREANVQALVLLAMHGEDYASPNLSWMLLGHACRQAEALGLHIPAHQLSESHQQRRLCLFWLLFTIDKSCSLAFGRPAFLPTAVYHNVPMPKDQELLKFHPHDRAVLGNRQARSHVSKFGVQLLSRSFDFIKLIGIMLDLLTTGKSSLTKSEIRFKLHAWYP